MFHRSFSRRARPVLHPMEEALHIRRMGSVADAGNRHYRHYAVPDALFATSNGQSKPADHPVQSPALVLPMVCYQKKEDHLLAHYSRIVLPVPDRRPVPVVCRGHLVFGIMFADTKYTSY